MDRLPLMTMLRTLRVSHLAFAALAITAVAVAPSVIAQVQNAIRPSADAERACLQQAVILREEAKLEARRGFNRATEQWMQQRIQDLAIAWDIQDPAERRRATDEIERRFREATGQADRTLREHERLADEQFRTQERTCQEQRRDMERLEQEEERRRQEEERRRQEELRRQQQNAGGNGQIVECLSDQHCPSGEVCSVSRGDCLPVCQGQICIQACGGVCETQFAGFSSFSSSSRSSSSLFFSSRSSAGFSSAFGEICKPHVCADGRTFPSCGPGGNPINYLVDPCLDLRQRATCGNRQCEEGEATVCPCDAVAPEQRHLCTAPCRVGSCPQDCTTTFLSPSSRSSAAQCAPGLCQQIVCPGCTPDTPPELCQCATRCVTCPNVTTQSSSSAAISWQCFYRACCPQGSAGRDCVNANTCRGVDIAVACSDPRCNGGRCGL